MRYKMASYGWEYNPTEEDLRWHQQWLEEVLGQIEELEELAEHIRRIIEGMEEWLDHNDQEKEA
jgi:hypothetical protein